jgi:hypothetical protein
MSTVTSGNTATVTMPSSNVLQSMNNNNLANNNSMNGSAIMNGTRSGGCGCILPNVEDINNGILNPVTRNEQMILGAKECKCISIPILNINGQTLTDGNDMGDVIFTIIDKFQYYCPDEIPPCQNKCGVYHAKESELKKTQFRQCCPKIVSVLIGEGKTAYDKLENIFITLGQDAIGVDFQTFYPRVFFYAMVKYVLGRILYGEFDINVLLRKNNEKFLKDLGKSRFCEALHIFLDCDSNVFGYDRYFKWDKECKRNGKKLTSCEKM